MCPLATQASRQCLHRSCWLAGRTTPVNLERQREMIGRCPASQCLSRRLLASPCRYVPHCWEVCSCTEPWVGAHHERTNVALAACARTGQREARGLRLAAFRSRAGGWASVHMGLRTGWPVGPRHVSTGGVWWVPVAPCPTETHVGAPLHYSSGWCSPCADTIPGEASGCVGRPSHVEHPEGVAWSTVACGFTHTLALDVDGAVFSCGSGRHGELGLGACTVCAAQHNECVPFPAFQARRRASDVFRFLSFACIG
mgnify:CR=1 FL=1